MGHVGVGFSSRSADFDYYVELNFWTWTLVNFNITLFSNCHHKLFFLPSCCKCNGMINVVFIFCNDFHFAWICIIFVQFNVQNRYWKQLIGEFLLFRFLNEWTPNSRFHYYREIEIEPNQIVHIYRAISGSYTDKSHFKNHDTTFCKINGNLIGIWNDTEFPSNTLETKEKRNIHKFHVLHLINNNWLKKWRSKIYYLPLLLASNSVHSFPIPFFVAF